METRLRAAVIAGCRVSFMLEVTSRDAAAAAVDEGSLPGHKKNTYCSLRGRASGFVNQALSNQEG